MPDDLYAQGQRACRAGLKADGYPRTLSLASQLEWVRGWLAERAAINAATEEKQQDGGRKHADSD